MLTPLLLCFLGAGSPTATAVPVVTPVATWQEPAVAIDAYDNLVTEYTKAVKANKAAIRATKDLQERRELRKAHPAHTFKPRFNALVEAGDGRGLLWEIKNQRYLGVPKNKRAEQKLDHYGRVVGNYGSAARYQDALETIGNDARLEGSTRVNILKRVFTQKDISEANKIAATFHVGAILMESKDEADNKMGKLMLKELIAKHPKSEFATRAIPLAEKVNVNVGAMAPNFIGTAPDGSTFNLSDYRGKVVMLDFFGFW